VQPFAPPGRWDSLPSRVEANTRLLLEILDRRRVRATFFVLGWVAERFPALVREIAAAGHQIGCHSYEHQLVYDLGPQRFREDTLLALDAIEAACGVRARAYRAPSYSITRASMWALDILAECGFTHDSSIYPVAHDRYGIEGFPRHAHRVETAYGPLVEAPAASVALTPHWVVPSGGGAYLRLLPYRYTAAGIRRLNRVERQPAIIYTHPWEFDPAVPRLAQGRLSRWRTYGGLAGVRAKFERLLDEFDFTSFDEVHPPPAR
jgi:polysaccharide deacetylase family protein (PEP-CTERM system associated)